MVLSIPKRLVKKEVNMDTKPKASKGSVVSSPSMVLDSPVVSRIAPINGPTPASAGRKFTAISIIPVIRSARFVASFCSAELKVIWCRNVFCEYHADARMYQSERRCRNNIRWIDIGLISNVETKSSVNAELPPVKIKVEADSQHERIGQESGSAIADEW